MKSARVNDVWRRVTEKNLKFRLKSIKIDNKPPLKNISVELGLGLTVICGLNGVGKTTLLRLLEGSLLGRSSIEAKCRAELVNSGTSQVVIVRDGVEVECSPEGEESSPARLFDAFSSSTRLLQLGTQPNFQDLLEGVEARKYEAAEIDEVAYVIGRRYEAIEVFEITDPASDQDESLPVFKVRFQNYVYDFNSMGLGELAALTSLWQLNRLEEGTVVLLEEPETFLSSRATVALLNVLAAKILSSGLYAVVTTHSPEILASVPFSAIRLLSMSDDGVHLGVPNSRAELEYALGATVGQAKIVITEDKTAMRFASELLSRFAGIWGQTLEVVAAPNGVSDVFFLCERLPPIDSLRVVGLVDGDQQVPNKERIWPIKKIPGSLDPDSTLRASALSNRELFAERLSRKIATLNTALDPLEGLDSHDWFFDLSKVLMLEPDSVVRAAIHCWLADPDNAQAAAAFVGEIKAALIDP